MYLDESGIERYVYREYGRSPIGQPVMGKISGKKYKRTSIVAGLCCGRIIAPMQFDGTMNSTLFEFWFANTLLLSLEPGSVIVLDNARFHRKNALEQLAAQAGCSVLFLPPYSPDLNPIEKFWAWLKAMLKKILPEFSSLDDAISHCFKLV